MSDTAVVCVVMAGVLDSSHIGSEANIGGVDIGVITGVVHRCDGTRVETDGTAPFAHGPLAGDTLVMLTKIKGE